jgi:hypothetical protein
MKEETYMLVLWEHKPLSKVLSAQARRRSADPSMMLKCHL